MSAPQTVRLSTASGEVVEFERDAPLVQLAAQGLLGDGLLKYAAMQLVNAVRKMRDDQRAFFAGRFASGMEKAAAVARAKKTEAVVDKLLHEVTTISNR